MDAAVVSRMTGERCAESGESRFNEVTPVTNVFNGLCSTIEGSDGDTVFLTGNSSIEFEGVSGCSMDEVRNTCDVFEFILIHG